MNYLVKVDRHGLIRKTQTVRYDELFTFKDFTILFWRYRAPTNTVFALSVRLEWNCKHYDKSGNGSREIKPSSRVVNVYNKVIIDLVTHDVDGISNYDIKLARIVN